MSEEKTLREAMSEEWDKLEAENAKVEESVEEEEELEVEEPAEEEAEAPVEEPEKAPEPVEEPAEEEKPPWQAGDVEPLEHWANEDKDAFKKMPREAQEFLISRDKKFQAHFTRKLQEAPVKSPAEPVREPAAAPPPVRQPSTASADRPIPASASGKAASAEVQPTIGSEGNPTFKVRVDWVFLNASVRDRYSNRSIPNLEQGDFEIYEDGVMQELGHFENAEAPFHLLLLLDISGSTAGFIDLSKEASIRFTGEINANECHYCLDCQVTYWNEPSVPRWRNGANAARKAYVHANWPRRWC